jgi:hypothetical protein
MIVTNTKVSKVEGVDVTELNGEKVMMNLETGKYFVLNDVASRIWESIQVTIVVNEIISGLLNEYDIDKSTCETGVISFLSKLNYAKLIHVV